MPYSLPGYPTENYPEGRTPMPFYMSHPVWNALTVLLVLVTGSSITPRAFALGPPKPGKAPVATANHGLIVGYPRTADGSPQDLTAFGDACGFYLSITVAGRPEFGRTPLLSSVERVRLQRKFANYRWTAGEGSQIATRLGATLVAAGTIEEAGGQVSLSYQFHTPKGAPVKTGLKIQGTREEIIKRLPGFSNQLAALLGAKAQPAPGIQATVEEMIQIGEAVPELRFTDRQMSSLAALSKHIPLAAALYLMIPHTDAKIAAFDQTAKLALTGFQENPLIYGNIGYYFKEKLESRKARVVSLAKQYPQNYPLTATLVWACRVTGDEKQEMATARRGVKLAPKNPDAYLNLGGSIYETSNRIRHGKFIGQMTDTELQRVSNIYPEWLETVTRAVELDPQHTRAWVRVSTAAAFAGHDEIAVKAWERARQLGGEASNVYHWGIQLFQPKWYDNPAKLQQVATEAVTASYDTVEEAMRIALDIHGAGLTDIANRFLNDQLGQWQEAAAREPDNIDVHSNLANIYFTSGNMEAAIEEYRKIASLRPNDANTHFTLAVALSKLNRLDEALEVLKQTIGIAPNHAGAYARMAWVLKHQNRLAEAEAAARKALTLKPDSLDANVILGTILTYQYQNEGKSKAKAKAALAVYRRAIAIRPVHEACHNSMIILTDLEDWDGVLETLRHLIPMHPEDAGYWITASHCFLQKKHWQNAEKLARVALKLEKDNPSALCNVGIALLYQKKKAEGESYCQRALTLNADKSPGMRAEIEQARRDNP